MSGVNTRCRGVNIRRQGLILLSLITTSVKVKGHISTWQNIHDLILHSPGFAHLHIPVDLYSTPATAAAATELSVSSCPRRCPTRDSVELYISARYIRCAKVYKGMQRYTRVYKGMQEYARILMFTV